MSDKSPIEWTDATWNPIVGCSVVSPGCTNCYAMRLAGTRLKDTAKYKGLTRASKAGPVWTGEVRLWESALLQPLKWRTPKKIFVNSEGDLFHESIPDAWIDRVFAVMALCPQHTFQVLTKRAERMRKYLTEASSAPAEPYTLNPKGFESVTDAQWQGAIARGFPLDNVWLGVSCERQQEADERIPLLLQTPAAIRFVSAEPLLGKIAFGDWLIPHDIALSVRPPVSVLDWIIVGGESGPSARPMHPQWARDIRDQCAVANVVFFFKQWGEHAPIPISKNRPIHPRRFYLHGRSFPFEQIENYALVRCGKKTAGRHLDGKLHNEFPMPRVTGGDSPKSLRSHESKHREASA